jgi:RNA polymerase subunit RPABC4/transcription elongation factor Spt4
VTVPLRICSTCRSSIPQGELYCPTCGASSPTEGVATVLVATRAERVSEPGIDLVARRAEVQAALGTNFEIKSLIGRGGFGEVWSALDVQLGRDVAVKVLRPEVGNDPEFRKRFRREARAVARLRHPGIVPIYHVGESGGMVWFIMPLVEGITLRAALAAPGGLTRDEAVRILIEASASLGEAHARGIVHRDIKPENIMLEGPQRRVLLMDFGVAKMEGQAEGEGGATAADMVLGSPEYMSPEQATARPLDARSDIYSLGVVAYKMLSGRLPFEGDTPREILAHHVLTAPTRLQVHAPVRAALADAVMRCLAKTPEARWQTAAEFARALAAASPSASLLAANQVRSLWTRLVGRMPFLARRRNAVLAAVVLIVVLFAAVLWPLLVLSRRRAWSQAAAAIALVYRHGADSLGVLAGAFARGNLTGPQFASAREEILGTAEADIEDRFGAEVDDSARWPGSARAAVREAARAIESAGAMVAVFEPGPSDVPGCRLVSVGAALRLTDDAPRTNCWFAAGAGGALAAPIEYFARFKVESRLRSGAGVGLAWCRNSGECRIIFVWPAAAAVWGSHQRHRGLAALALGRRVALAPGDHELRVRWQRGMLTCRLDGGLVLERRAGADSVFLQRPDSIAFVVQNTRVELPGPDALGAVGAVHPPAPH